MDKLLTLLFKMYFDRRRNQGADEFAFTWRSARLGIHQFTVKSRDGSFQYDISLRAKTSDLAVFEMVFCNNDYNLRRLERWTSIRQLYEKISRQSVPLILDIGANIGMASVYFSKNWPAAKILAVEPDSRNFEMLSRNVSGLTNVLPVMAAVAATDGLASIVNVNSDAWALQTRMAQAGENDVVPAVSINTLLATEKSIEGMSPFICKIDIEGFEKNLFSSNTDWVEKFPIIIIELHDWMLPREKTSASFLQEISRHDRDFVYIAENVFSIANNF